ncbi:hypothetical protein FRC18_008241 [Serendipita sp. 400]|nr:hypothetical protein FRC18_008241 [Serendipita sp. 400]
MSITQLPEEIISEIIQYLNPNIYQSFATQKTWSCQTDEWHNWWYPASPTSEYAAVSRRFGLNRAYNSLLAFSRTNKRFRIICAPLIFAKMSVTTTRDYHMAMDHRQHVRFLRIKIRQADPWVYQRYPVVTSNHILSILTACSNVKTLVVLYDYKGHIMDVSPSDISSTSLPVSQKIVSLLHSGQLQILAATIHTGSVDAGESDITVGPTALLSRIFGTELSLSDQQAIHLALYFSAMPEVSLDQPLEVKSGPNAIVKTICPFSPCPNLVSLQLVECFDMQAQFIPELVLQLSKLQYLYVASSPDNQDFSLALPPERSSGWSREDDALWRQRGPLKELHIAESRGWEIRAMGVIPALVVIVTEVPRSKFQKSFLDDPEIFPCMEVLLCEPKNCSLGCYEGYSKTWIDVLKEQNITLMADAPHSNLWR